MLKIIRNLLIKLVEDLDAGNTNISEEDSLELINILQTYTDNTKRLSKYQACKYLNVSRATFDNYVRSGQLPKGKKESGFKELSWSKRDLDSFIRSRK